MSLVLNLAKYIAASSSLVVDTNLFVGTEPYDAPSGSVIVRELPGSVDNESRFKNRFIQIVAKDLAYVDAETLATTVYVLLAHKKGFTDANLTGESIRYVDVVYSPGVLDRDEQGNYLFSAVFIVRTG